MEQQSRLEKNFWNMRGRDTWFIDLGPIPTIINFCKAITEIHLDSNLWIESCDDGHDPVLSRRLVISWDRSKNPNTRGKKMFITTVITKSAGGEIGNHFDIHDVETLIQILLGFGMLNVEES